MARLNGYNGDYERREQLIFGESFKGNDTAGLRNATKNSLDMSIEESSAIYNKFYAGGIRRFDNLTVEKLKTLVKEEYIHMSDDHNGCPCVEEMLKFASKIAELEDCNMQILFSGYAVSPNRKDYCVNIDGISYRSTNGYRVDREAVDMFWDFIQSADDRVINAMEGSAWWD